MGDALIGATVAERYQVVRKLGQGGMGAIYEVVHLKLQRSFVLKRLAATLTDDDEALSRFQREAQVVASLRHPNIVEISDWETLPDGAPCMILEFLRGEDLDARIERGPLAWTDIFRIAEQAMSALAVAHRADVVHRDLKPHNIFLALDDNGEEHVKLLDFGISKIRNSASITNSQVLMGTPAYMSPEQAHGRSAEIGPATDVWALGALIYEMATGRQPFIAESIPSTLLLITTTPPPSMLELRPDTPPALVRVIEDTMSLDPVRRVQTIDELRRRLARIDVPTTPKPISSGPRSAVIAPTTLSVAAGEGTVSSPRRRNRKIVPAAIVACLVGLVTFAVVWSMRDESKGARGSGDVAANGVAMDTKAGETNRDTKPTDTNRDTTPTDTNRDTAPTQTNPPGTNPTQTNPPGTNPTQTNPPGTNRDTNPPGTNRDTAPTQTNPPGTNRDTAPTQTNPPGTNPTQTNPPGTNRDTNPPGTKPLGTDRDTAPTQTNPPGPNRETNRDTKPIDARPRTTFHDVRVVVSPDGAAMSLDGRPVRGASLRVPVDGKHHRLVIRADGYEAQTATLDDTTSTLTIKLVKQQTEPQPIGL